MKSTAIVALACLLALPVTGCVEKTKSLTRAERSELLPFVSKTKPHPSHPLDISFENKLQILGYDASATTWKPGEKVTFTWYWKTDKALEEGWHLFTHVADASGANRLNQDGVGTVRQLYPPGRWKNGEYIKDVQEMVLPPDWNSPSATIYVGVWNGPHRLEITKGPNDGDNRARLLCRSPRGPRGAPAPDRHPSARWSRPCVPRSSAGFDRRSTASSTSPPGAPRRARPPSSTP